MKRLALLGSLVLVLMSVARASDIYIAQAAAGGNTGADCADAKAYSYFNSSATGGNTYHLCGTFTFSANTNGLTVPASGTAGAPLIILFEPGAILQSPYFPGDYIDSGSALGAIVVSNKNYIIIDGGTNGIIQNTNNGTLLTRNKSFGMTVGGSNIIVRNLTIQNIYVVANGSEGDAIAVGTLDLLINYNTSNVTVCNNTFTEAYSGIVTYAIGASTQVTNCQSNTFGTGTNIFLNTFTDQAWHIANAPEANSSPNIYANQFNTMGVWGVRVTGCDGNDAHTDGIINYNQGANVMVNAYIYNNKFVEDLGNGCPTAHIYCSYGFGSGGGSSCNVFNNVLVSTRTSGGAGSVIMGGGSGYVVGPHKIYNNTEVNNEWAHWVSNQWQSAGNDKYRNNIISTVQNATGSFFYGYNTSAPYSVLDTDYFVYYDPTTSGSAGWWVKNTTYNSPSAWKTGCTSGGGSPCDANSVYGNPLLDSNYRLQAGSPAIGAAQNLTSSCTGQMAPLCYDKPPNVGYGGSLGGNSARPATGGWDVGAYQYSSGVVPPAGLAVTVH